MVAGKTLLISSTFLQQQTVQLQYQASLPAEQQQVVQSNQQCLLEEVEHACVAQGEDRMIQQSTYFGPNFRKWSEFGLFPENQSEFAQNV